MVPLLPTTGVPPWFHRLYHWVRAVRCVRTGHAIIERPLSPNFCDHCTQVFR